MKNLLLSAAIGDISGEPYEFDAFVNGKRNA